LKFNDLKQLVCVLITTSQHFFEFNDNVIKKKINESQAFYSRGEEIWISHKLRPYAQQMSIELLEQLKEKYQKRRS